MKTLYKMAHRAAVRLRLAKLERWAYRKWMFAWMKADPTLGYWRFAEEYFAELSPRRAAAIIQT